LSGFDNGTLQGGVFAQTKQFGSILRGFGPPVPGFGVVGDLYIDTQTWFLYEKRATDTATIDAWGHYLFQVPNTYRTGLKYFATSAPTDDIGVNGDYCMLWGGYANYGMLPALYGPKVNGKWPENGDGGTLPIAAPGTITPVGLLAEGAALPESNSTQLVMTGLQDEVLAPIPVLESVGSAVQQIGLKSGPSPVAVVINPLYTATDGHAVP